MGARAKISILVVLAGCTTGAAVDTEGSDLYASSSCDPGDRLYQQNCQYHLNATSTRSSVAVDHREEGQAGMVDCSCDGCDCKYALKPACETCPEGSYPAHGGSTCPADVDIGNGDSCNGGDPATTSCKAGEAAEDCCARLFKNECDSICEAGFNNPFDTLSCCEDVRKEGPSSGAAAGF